MTSSDEESVRPYGWPLAQLSYNLFLRKYKRFSPVVVDVRSLPPLTRAQKEFYAEYQHILLARIERNLVEQSNLALLPEFFQELRLTLKSIQRANTNTLYGVYKKPIVFKSRKRQVKKVEEKFKIRAATTYAGGCDGLLAMASGRPQTLKSDKVIDKEGKLVRDRTSYKVVLAVFWRNHSLLRRYKMPVLFAYDRGSEKEARVLYYFAPLDKQEEERKKKNEERKEGKKEDDPIMGSIGTFLESFEGKITRVECREIVPSDEDEVALKNLYPLEKVMKMMLRCLKGKTGVPSLLFTEMEKYQVKQEDEEKEKKTRNRRKTGALPTRKSTRKKVQRVDLPKRKTRKKRKKTSEDTEVLSEAETEIYEAGEDTAGEDTVVEEDEDEILLNLVLQKSKEDPEVEMEEFRVETPSPKQKKKEDRLERIIRKIKKKTEEKDKEVKEARRKEQEMRRRQQQQKKQEEAQLKRMWKEHLKKVALQKKERRLEAKLQEKGQKMAEDLEAKERAEELEEHRKRHEEPVAEEREGEDSEDEGPPALEGDSDFVWEERE